MRHPESLDGFLRHRGGRRHLRQGTAIRPPESQSPVRPARALVALLVHGTVMPSAQKCEVRERGRTALRPVTEMMSVAEADAAARYTATPVPRVERPTQGGGNSPCPGPYLQQVPVV